MALFLLYTQTLILGTTLLGKGRKKMKKKRRKRKVEKRGVGEEKKKKKKKVISYLKDRLLVVYCDQAEILFPLHTHVFVLRPNAQK